MKNTAEYIVRQLQENGFQAVLCGGCVRDMLLGIEPKDYDIATNALPDEVERVFSGHKTLQCGKQFLVVRIVVNGFEFEIATFRSDGEYKDGRRPENVQVTDMKGDARRRDFTLNALFFDPILNKVYDFVGGIRDINNCQIRFVGNPTDRINEDYIRVLRAVRFESRLRAYGFSLEENSAFAVSDNAHLLTKVAAEYLRAELNKGLLCESGPDYFLALNNYDIWGHIVPEIHKLNGCKQDPEWHPEGDVFTHTYIVLKNIENWKSEVLVWGAILHDIGKPDTFGYNDKGRISAHGHAAKGAHIAEEILRSLRFSSESIRDICSLVKHHMDFMQIQNMKKSKRRRFYARSTFEFDLALHRADCIGSNGNLENYEFAKKESSELPESLSLPDWFVTGRDLIDLGLKPGPAFKEILGKLQDEQLEGSFDSREDAINRMNTLISEKF